MNAPLAWPRMIRHEYAVDMIGGCRIVICDALPIGREQFCFPRSKRKRIRRKWAKRDANWRSVHYCCRLDDTFYVTREFFNSLRDRVLNSIHDRVVDSCAPVYAPYRGMATASNDCNSNPGRAQLLVLKCDLFDR